MRFLNKIPIGLILLITLPMVIILILLNDIINMVKNIYIGLLL